MKLLDFAVFNQAVGSSQTEAQTGVTSWNQDFPTPRTSCFWWTATQSSRRTTRTSAMSTTREVTSGIAELSRRPELTDEVTERWGELNKRVVTEALITPFGHATWATFMSGGWTSRTARSSTGLLQRLLELLPQMSRGTHPVQLYCTMTGSVHQ